MMLSFLSHSQTSAERLVYACQTGSNTEGSCVFIVHHESS